MIKKVSIAFFLLFIIFNALIAHTSYANNSINDIKAKWKQFKPVYEGIPYVEEPSSKAPYKAGKVSKPMLQDAANMMNFMRCLAGLPDDVELDDTLCSQAQHGAVLLAATNKMSHTPSRPADMDEEFYKLGYKSTTSSNIFWASGYQINTLLNRSITSYMSDSDASNIDRVGHRRWILNPQMKKTGFGLANGFSTMQAFDRSRTEKVNYDYVAWPGIESFPKDFFSSKDAWSISLNPEKYDNKKISNIKVSLTRKSDNKIWDFDNKNTDKNGKFFNVETSGYGIPFCVIFRPEGIERYNDGDGFSVKVTGLYDKTGAQKEIEYSVEFFKLENIIVLYPDNKYLYINNVMEELDPGKGTKPVIVKDRLMLPIRLLVEKLGGSVEWASQENAAYIKLNDKSIKVTIGSNKALVNDVTKELDVEPQIINERTMLPLRFIIENLGYEVKWDDTKRSVTITY